MPVRPANSKNPLEKIILGIDPGTVVLGYGVIKQEGQKLTAIQLGVVKLDKYKSHEIRLAKIYEKVTQLINEFLPDEMAIESPFLGKNIQSTLKLGRAQGIAMAAAIARQIPIVEYAPRKVKLSVTGSGNASKEQVQYMVRTLLNIEETPDFYDATDALAVAICHSYQIASLAGKGGTKKASSWKEFIENNPERVKK